jgi:hypothetical protein
MNASPVNEATTHAAHVWLFQSGQLRPHRLRSYQSPKPFLGEKTFKEFTHNS